MFKKEAIVGDFNGTQYLNQTLQGAVSGAIGGGLGGSVVPGVGTALGAGVGAATGAVGGLLSGTLTDAYFHFKTDTNKIKHLAGETEAGLKKIADIINPMNPRYAQFLKNLGTNFKEEVDYYANTETRTAQTFSRFVEPTKRVLSPIGQNFIPGAGSAGVNYYTTQNKQEAFGEGAKAVATGIATNPISNTIYKNVVMNPKIIASSGGLGIIGGVISSYLATLTSDALEKWYNGGIPGLIKAIREDIYKMLEYIAKLAEKNSKSNIENSVVELYENLRSVIGYA